MTLFDIVLRRELIKETRVALLTRTEISQMWHKPNLAVKGISIFFEVWRSFNTGSISYGVDLAVLSLCNHTVNPHIRSKTCSQVLDYGTFGLWAALLAGGRIVLPSGFPKEKVSSSTRKSKVTQTWTLLTWFGGTERTFPTWNTLTWPNSTLVPRHKHEASCFAGVSSWKIKIWIIHIFLYKLRQEL